MKVLGTGLSGLVGSRITQLLSPGYEFENLSLETGVDITDKAVVDRYFSTSESTWVFHLAAYTDVQGAQKEQGKGEESIAWKVNVSATEYIAESCKRYGKKLLYLDTDYAFDGTKKSYTEEDTPNPLGWYAKTKYEGALRVLALGGDALVLRISNPYRAFPVGKMDFMHKMLDRMRSGGAVSAPDDQLFAPTFIDDIADAVAKLIDLAASGTYHAVGTHPLSPYEAARTIAREYGLDDSLVGKTTFASMFADRAPIPQWAALSNEKLAKIGVVMRSFPEGVAEVKRQESIQKTG